MLIPTARQRIDRITPHLRKLSYPLINRRRLLVKQEGGKTIISLTDGGQETRKVGFRPKLSWSVCNPYKLMEQLGIGSLRVDMQRMWKGIENEAADPTSCLGYLSKAMMLRNEADVVYYAITLLSKKIRSRKIPQDQIAAAQNVLKWLVISAFAERDVPKIVYINAYLAQLTKVIDLQEIEGLFPQMTTENLVGTLAHVLKI